MRNHAPVIIFLQGLVLCGQPRTGTSEFLAVEWRVPLTHTNQVSTPRSAPGLGMEDEIAKITTTSSSSRVLRCSPTVCCALSHMFLQALCPLCFLAALRGGAYDNPRSLISALRLRELNVSFPESHWRQYLTTGFTVTRQPLPRQRRGLALPSLLTAISQAPQPSEPPPFHPRSQPS